jgi:putative hemolysin
MQASAVKSTLSLAPILPPALRHVVQPLEPALLRFLVPGEVLSILETAGHGCSGARFAEHLLDSLNVRFPVDDRDLLRVPESGAAVVMANHPYGIVEGLILMVVLDRLRPDAKLLANSVLAGINELRPQMILVDPFERPEARMKNHGPLREAVHWLSRQGLLTTFPAREVAHLDWKQQSITDPPWRPAAARLALRARCPVLPVYFQGANSVPFHLAGTLHPGLRTAALAHEFHKLRGRKIRFRIGSPIPYNVLAAYPDSECATEYLRSRTFFLSNRAEFVAVPPGFSLNQMRRRAIDPPGDGRLLSEEVAALPVDSELAANGEFSVYLAESEQIPHMLQEIGRCREQAFREVGEGTGKDLDLDRFDTYYQHLFLWSKTDRRLAGAYRLAITTDVLPRHGLSGLYTSTLFRFHDRFFARLGPAVELGRSFVLPQYQKNYASLLLLWKGITRVVQHRPEAPVLFGGVSISSQYRAASRGLIATYLSGRASHELARFVQPRRKFRDPAMRSREIRRFAAAAASIEDVSLSIADIEEDSKGVPVLLRQYLKAGGRLLAFNLDPNFSNALDALIIADLRTAPPALLERCMGRDGAKAFLESHGVRC